MMYGKNYCTLNAGKDELIPYFSTEDAKKRAVEMQDKNERIAFFNHTDIALATLKGRLVFNRICGIHIYSPFQVNNKHYYEYDYIISLIP